MLSTRGRVMSSAGSVRAWVGMVVAAVLLVPAAETACGQQYVPAGPRPEDIAVSQAMNESLESQFSTVAWLTTGAFWFAIVCGLVALAWLAARLYYRLTRPTDPTKFAMNDPWVRAHFAQLNGGAPGQPPAEADAAPDAAG